MISPESWGALQRSLQLYRAQGIDVAIVSHGQSTPRVQQNVAKFRCE